MHPPKASMWRGVAWCSRWRDAPPAVSDVYRHHRSYNFAQEDSARQAFRQAVRDVVAYDERADGWCNTLLVAGCPAELIEVPAGMGMSFMMGEMRLPPRSGYLLLQPDTYARLADRLLLEPLGSTSLGTLYRNRDANC
jgi:hypothetical protein